MSEEAEFFLRCKRLLGDTSEREWKSENLSGFFQDFRPDGARLGEFFADIPLGDEVFARLQQVYQATNTQPFDPQRMDWYFIVREPVKGTDQELAALAKAQLKNWRLIAEEFEDDELLAELKPLPKVQVSHEPAPDPDPHDTESLDIFIYEAQTDWHGSLTPVCQHAEWLREAFYYLACDYYLAHYVTWPWYRESSEIEDPCQPYFELWRHGAKLCCESREKVVLYVP